MRTDQQQQHQIEAEKAAAALQQPPRQLLLLVLVLVLALAAAVVLAAAGLFFAVVSVSVSARITLRPVCLFFSCRTRAESTRLGELAQDSFGAQASRGQEAAAGGTVGGRAAAGAAGRGTCDRESGRGVRSRRTF